VCSAPSLNTLSLTVITAAEYRESYRMLNIGILDTNADEIEMYESGIVMLRGVV
jgi:hypothetical protein